MSEQPFTRGFWPRLGLAFGIWTLLGLFDASHSLIHYAYEDDPVAWWRVVGMGLALWYAWAVLAAFIFRIAWLFPLEGRAWRWRLPLQIATGPLFALAKLVLDYPIIREFYCPHPEQLTFPVFYRMGFASHFHTYVIIAWALFGVSHAWDYRRRLRERELRASQLETRLARAELQVLKMQLHPHFLFNTLHAIAALIPEDADRAERMLVRLGDLLRLTLENAGANEVCLRRELEFIQAYLEIEQVRFGSRLAVQMEIDPETQDAYVPYLVLQPLVENAIRYGIAPQVRGGLVAVRASRENGRLRLSVEDDGPGLSGATKVKPGRGIGLTNTRARLEQLYGAKYRFELRPGGRGGLLVTVEVPYSTTPTP
jgi:signal transduction histidine kinase